jgi:hypothetical protein
VGGAVAVALAALILPLVAGASTGIASQLPDAGHLTLGFDGFGNSFRFFPPGSAVTGAPAAGNSQTLAVSGCTVTTGATLAKVTTKVGNQNGGVGASSGSGNTVVGLGVKTNNGTGASGTRCGQVNLGESMTLQLGSNLTQTAVDRAELDIDAKYSVVVQANLFLGGSPVGVRTLATNTVGSDSGPDCGSCDNFAFPISGALFDTIVLSAQASTNNQSAFSLQGGVGTACTAGANVNATNLCDGLRASLSTRQSVFHLVHFTGTLNCGDSSDPSTGGDTTSTVTRLANDNCQAVPYSLITDPNLVKFGKDLSGQSAAQFVMNVTWDPEPATTPPGNTHTTQITYTDDAGYHALQWCVGVSYSGGNVTSATPPPGEFWCLVSHDDKVVGAGTAENPSQIVVHELLYGTGDPGLKR